LEHIYRPINPRAKPKRKATSLRNKIAGVIKPIRKSRFSANRVNGSINRSIKNKAKRDANANKLLKGLKIAKRIAKPSMPIWALRACGV